MKFSGKMRIYKLMLLLPFLFISCNHPTEDGDLLYCEWKLQSMSINNTRLNIPTDNIADKTSYILNFDSDTTFSFSTSVNRAGGKCAIFYQEKHLTISGYQEWTEIGQGDVYRQTFDENLLSEFHGLMSYVCSGNKLTITNEHSRFLFEKQ